MLYRKLDQSQEKRISEWMGNDYLKEVAEKIGETVFLWDDGTNLGMVSHEFPVCLSVFENETVALSIEDYLESLRNERLSFVLAILNASHFYIKKGDYGYRHSVQYQTDLQSGNWVFCDSMTTDFDHKEAFELLKILHREEIDLEVTPLSAYIKDGKIVGLAAPRTEETGALQIDLIGTHPDYRRQGIAKEMHHHLLAWGQKMGFTMHYSEIEYDNEAMHKIYRASGSIKLGEVIKAMRA